GGGATKGDRGVFHATHVRSNIKRYGARIFQPCFTVVFDGCLCVFGRTLPGVSSMAVYGVGRESEGFFSAGVVDFGAIDHKGWGRGPGEIMCLVEFVFPGQAFFVWTRVGISYICCGSNNDSFIALLRA